MHCTHEDFIVVTSPAIGVAVNGMSVGRPYGGVATLVHRKYAVFTYSGYKWTLHNNTNRRCDISECLSAICTLY